MISNDLTWARTSGARSESPLTELSATEAAASIRAAELKSEELVRALLQLIEAKSEWNALIGFDAELALRAAREADALAAQGHFRGPLHGVPLAVKDNIHVAGFACTAGTRALKGFYPKAHAPVVERLVKAGALVLAKTNLHELAFGITSQNAAFGWVRNAYDRTRSAGGSSGGTGAAIGARMVPAGLGTDTGGSIRIPSALNGIAGLRPTLLRYPQEGVIPIAHTRDTAGPMARTVADLVLLDGIITGTPLRLEPASLKGVRLGVARGGAYEGVEAGTAKLTRQAQEQLTAAGVMLVDVDMAPLTEVNAQVGFPVALFEAYPDLEAHLALHGTGLTAQQVAASIASPDVKGLFHGAILPGAQGAIPPKLYEQALKVHRPRLQQLYTGLFREHRIEALLFPVTPLPALPIEGLGETFEFLGQTVPTFPTFIRHVDSGSNAGLPGLSLPMGLTSESLPVGLGLDGPESSDRRLLELGLALERVLGRLPPPPLT